MQTVLADQQKATFVLRTRHGICDEATVICFGPFETREQAEKFGVALLGDDNTDGVGSTAKVARPGTFMSSYRRRHPFGNSRTLLVYEIGELTGGNLI